MYIYENRYSIIAFLLVLWSKIKINIDIIFLFFMYKGCGGVILCYEIQKTVLYFYKISNIILTLFFLNKISFY